MNFKHFIITLALSPLIIPPSAWAVSEKEDIATTIKLRGYDCPGREVQSLVKKDHPDGSKEVDATCNNGKHYHIVVNTEGRLSVTPQ